MSRTVFAVVVVVGVAALSACSLKKRAPNTCLNDDECPTGQKCSLTSPNRNQCVTIDGGTPGCSLSNPCPAGGPQACDMTTSTCVECVEEHDVHCTSPNGACDTYAKVCVECVVKDDCTGTKTFCDELKTCVQCLDDAGCGGTTPICETKACRACKTDGECVETGVCMEDGHCAPATEVVYVKNDQGVTCSDTGAGTASQPFCTPQMGIGMLALQRPVLRIDGPMAVDRLLFSGLTFGVVVVGKNAASISPGAGVGIRATDGAIVGVRGLTISGGAAIGVQADTGAQLHMDACFVENNALGGISINAAGYDVQNTIVARNGGTTAFGLRVRSPLPQARFSFNTVVNNPVATDCDQNIPGLVENSIIVGPTGNCSVQNSVPTTPTFDTARPYHLTASIGCPDGDPANPPDHDFDGDPRKSPFDCGADQHTF